MNIVELGKIIRSIRQHRNIKVIDLSVRAGVHTNTIWRIEQGRHHSVESLIAVLGALNYSLGLLRNEDRDKYVKLSTLEAENEQLRKELRKLKYIKNS